MKRKREVQAELGHVQIGDGNTMHVHGGRVDGCFVCGTKETAGDLGPAVRAGLHLWYCRAHAALAVRLWDFYAELLRGK